MNQHEHAVSILRRTFLHRGLLWGGAGAASATAALPGAAPASAAPHRTFTWDVACLGDTFRTLFTEGAARGDLRGSTFSVEGFLYPEGTIRGSGFDPYAVPALGHWLCRGWFLIHPGRPDPHVITTQEYLLDVIRAGRLFPEDTLTSSGTEGSDGHRQVPVRSVTGGTGRFAGATGVVRQHGVGTNTTTIPGIGPAPNFRFVFHVRTFPELD